MLHDQQTSIGDTEEAPGPQSLAAVYTAKARLFKILGHPTRIRILELVAAGEMSVGGLQTALELPASTTSQHLTVLRQHGVLDSRRAGSSVYYYLSRPELSELLKVARAFLTTTLTDSHSLLSTLTDWQQEAVG